MKKKKSLLDFCIIVTFIAITTFCFSSNAQALNYGDEMGFLKNVIAYSNGSYAGTSQGNYQCVEYVKRFYRDAFGVCLFQQAIGVARNYYLEYDARNLDRFGLVRYQNGQSAELPKPGDILVFNHTNRIGHVAIIRYVQNNSVFFIEQNWDSDECFNSLSITGNASNGNYTITNRENYTVLGWLHLSVGEYSTGWHFEDMCTQYSDEQSQPFVDAYLNNNDSDILGLPTGYVSSMPYGSGEIWWQNFEKNGHIYSLVRNDFVYNTVRLYLGAVYPVHGQIRNYWINAYWVFGPPVCNEYYYPEGTRDYVVQWFEPSDNYFVSIAYQTATGEFYENLSCISPDAEYFNQDKLKNCASNSEGCGGGEDPPPPPDYTYSGSWICEGKDSDGQPINQRTEFAAGDSVCALTTVTDISIPHRWLTEFYCNGGFSWDDESPWLNPNGTWASSSAAPVWENINPGSYTTETFLDTGNGYELKSENAFTVTNDGPDYVFECACVCEGWEYGSSDPNSPDYWNLQPINSGSVFIAGDTIYSFAKASDIFVDHSWKTEFYCDGVFSWADESPWMDVGSGWSYSTAKPPWANIGAGSYEARVLLDTGSGYELKAANSFTVNPPSAQTIPYSESFGDDQGGFILENNNGQGSMSQTTYDNRECLMISNNQAGECWHVQAKKVGLVIDNGTPYMHQIIAKADQPCRIYVVVQRDVDPWDNLGLWHEIDLTNEWQSFTLQFNANDTPDPYEVRYSIMIGNIAGTVYVDFIGLQN
ncbi:CHAP domain-containing protein [Candidatus Parcubacteria bacterium]|nr:CHAP domain-containing protein [Candidatus Parcubacteria bacterium]